jgi:hypothetical protein
VRDGAQKRLQWSVAGVLLTALALAAGCGRRAEAVPQSDPANQHKVSVQFDYDFAKSPSCAAKPNEKTCVKQFDVYDVSGQRFRLFSIPAPKATGMVKGITGDSPTRIFLPGTHFIAVTAEDAQGVESNTDAAKVQVEVKTNASK